MLQFNATFIVAMLSFVVFIIIMDRILYKPISAIVNERDEFINGNYKEAEENSLKSENIRKDRDDKLLKAHTDSRKIITDKVDAAHKTAKNRTEAAVMKSREEINLAKSDLNSKQQQIEAEVQKDMINLAETITDKLLGQHIPIDESEIVNKV